VLAVTAFASKILADGLPVWMLRNLPGAVLIGISMVPRAEIAMVIMQRGLNQGEWAVPRNIFNAMVIASIITCTLAPMVVQRLLAQWPQPEEKTR
jgi:Kef-type K+ transport system membrane component KefB